MNSHREKVQQFPHRASGTHPFLRLHAFNPMRAGSPPTGVFTGQHTLKRASTVTACPILAKLGDLRTGHCNPPQRSTRFQPAVCYGHQFANTTLAPKNAVREVRVRHLFSQEWKRHQLGIPFNIHLLVSRSLSQTCQSRVGNQTSN